MTTSVTLPQIELTMESAIIARWLVKVGDRVDAEQPIVEVETQKAISEVVAPASGFVRQLCAAEGDTISEKALLCILTDTGDEPIDNQSIRPSNSSATMPLASSSDPAGLRETTKNIEQIRATPLARKIAKDIGISLTQIKGTGPGGRITDQDVRNAGTITDGHNDSANASDWTPIPSTRLALIEQMQKSLAEIPQIHLHRQIDVTSITVKTEGVTFTHRLILAAAAALAKHPAVRTVMDGQRIKVEPVSIAVAINTRHGLVAPVVRRADELQIGEVAHSVTELRARAEANTLRRSDFANAPFAITNLGMLGVDFFQAFVFHGQTAVLSVGRSADAGGGRSAAWFGLALDHRIVDGAEGARFLETLQMELARA